MGCAGAKHIARPADVEVSLPSGTTGGAPPLGTGGAQQEESERPPPLEECSIEELSTHGTLEDYTLSSVLGLGGFGEVRRGVQVSTGQEVAVKLISKMSQSQKALEQEVAVMKAIGKHPNVVGLIDFFDPGAEQFVMVLELVSGGEVFDRISNSGAYSERDAAHVVMQVMLLSSL